MVRIVVTLLVLATGCIPVTNNRGFLSVGPSLSVLSIFDAASEHYDDGDESAARQESDRANAATRATVARLDAEHAASLAPALDRNMVADTMTAILPQTKTCSGEARVVARVRVAPSGAVTSVAFEDQLPATQASCLTATLRLAHFRETLAGGGFRYAFAL